MLARVVAKVRREAKARVDAIGRAPDKGFAAREQEYAMKHPRLMTHKHCGLCPDTDDRPRKRVQLSNGIVILTTWYRVPKTEADAKLALKEQTWLLEQAAA